MVAEEVAVASEVSMALLHELRPHLVGGKAIICIVYIPFASRLVGIARLMLMALTVRPLQCRRRRREL